MTYQHPTLRKPKKKGGIWFWPFRKPQYTPQLSKKEKTGDPDIDALMERNKRLEKAFSRKK